MRTTIITPSEDIAKVKHTLKSGVKLGHNKRKTMSEVSFQMNSQEDRETLTNFKSPSRAKDVALMINKWNLENSEHYSFQLFFFYKDITLLALWIKFTYLNFLNSTTV